MNKIVKYIIAPTVSITILLIAVFIFSYFYLKSTLPNYDGEIVSEKIFEDVEIYRDSLAVPYIIAKSQLSAAFALGFVHAQERLFQMDIMRRAGEGRLSEILGAKTISFDKMFKTLGLYHNVKNHYSQYDNEIISILESYAAGVNLFIKESTSNFPIEFSLLGYQPELWKPEHSLLIGKLLAWELNISWWTDVAFSHIVAKVGETKAKDILPDYDENDPFIISKDINLYSSAPNSLMKTDQDFRKFLGFEGTHIGSNNWVVNSSKSVSGSPIIANDPHLAFQIPGKWYLAVVRSPEWNVDGFTLPGVPAIIIGKNKHISWVVTNVMADDADFYNEHLNSDGSKYLLDNEWVDIISRNDTIIVKDSSNVVFEVRSNHRGPIISDIHPYTELFPDSIHSQDVTSMRWTALDFTQEFSAILDVNKSKNWEEFNRSLANFSVPGQNFVYGDNNGNIGYICAAKLPIRKNNSPTLIYDGRYSENDWQGFVDYNLMPKIFNPKTNYIASANNKTIKDFPYHISNLWEPSSRINRITEFLESKTLHSSDDFKNYQNDFYSKYAQKITPHILNAFSNAKINDKNLKTALNLIEGWDFLMDKESQTPTIFLTFFQYLLKNIFLDELGESLFNEYIFIANVPYRVVEELLSKNYSIWFDNIETVESESKNFIIRKSFSDALNQLEKDFGTNISLWQWGKIHNVTFKHMFHGESELVNRILSEGPYPISGDGTTIFNSEYSFTKPYENKLGPSMRFIYDFGSPDEFQFILPTGQSGNPFSRNYRDMTNAWLNKGYHKIKIDAASITSKDKQLFIIRAK